MRWAFPVMLMVGLSILGMAAVGALGGERKSGPDRLREVEPGQMGAFMKSLHVNYFMADISLEVREQDDFLLTPALLVQEAISDGVILTYPEE